MRRWPMSPNGPFPRWGKVGMGAGAAMASKVLAGMPSPQPSPSGGGSGSRRSCADGRCPMSPNGSLPRQRKVGMGAGAAMASKVLAGMPSPQPSPSGGGSGSRRSCADGRCPMSPNGSLPRQRKVGMGAGAAMASKVLAGMPSPQPSPSGGGSGSRRSCADGRWPMTPNGSFPRWGSIGIYTSPMCHHGAPPRASRANCAISCGE